MGRGLRTATAVLLAAATSLAQAPPADEEHPQVVGVELRLPPGSDPELLRDAPDLVAVRKGQKLSRRAVQRSIQRLFATGRFADVVVRALEAKGGVVVVFDIAPKQRISAITVAGARAVPVEEILAAARLEKDAEGYPEKIDEAVRAVAELYRRRGYQKVKARADPVDPPGGM